MHVLVSRGVQGREPQNNRIIIVGGSVSAVLFAAVGCKTKTESTCRFVGFLGQPKNRL